MHVMVRRSSLMALGLVCAMVVGFATTSPANADEGAIKYRQSVMEAMGGTMGAMAHIIKGQVPHKEDLKAHAQDMANLAKIVGHIFPEGSDKGGRTRAKADIWKNPQEFAKVLAAFQTQAAKFATVAESGDMTAAAAEFGKLGRTCGGCHREFRSRE